MAYDQMLAERIRALVADRPGVTEKEMFGGLAFLLEGRMFCCILGKELLARVGTAAEDAAKSRPHARPLNLIGYQESGCVVVQPSGLAGDSTLASWLDECLAHAATVLRKPKRRPPEVIDEASSKPARSSRGRGRGGSVGAGARGTP